MVSLGPGRPPSVRWRRAAQRLGARRRCAARRCAVSCRARRRRRGGRATRVARRRRRSRPASQTAPRRRRAARPRRPVRACATSTGLKYTGGGAELVEHEDHDTESRMTNCIGTLSRPLSSRPSRALRHRAVRRGSAAPGLVGAEVGERQEEARRSAPRTACSGRSGRPRRRWRSCVPATPATCHASRSDTPSGSRAHSTANAVAIPARMMAACSIWVWVTARVPPRWCRRPPRRRSPRSWAPSGHRGSPRR